MKKIKMIVGLANPGAKYEKTRHNVGSWYVKILAKNYNKKLQEKKFFCCYSTKIKKDIKIIVPTTFMNMSGTSVAAISKFYHIKQEEILIAHDELYLPPGSTKIKKGGINSGHNGIKDIQNKLGNKYNFYRISIGIGHPGEKKKIVDFVMENPQEKDLTRIKESINESVRCTEILWK